MKAGDIVDVAIEYADKQIAIELSNGVQITTTGYTYRRNKKDEPVLIIRTGRKLNT